MDHSLEHYQTIFKKIFEKFSGYTTDYLVTNAHRVQRNNIFWRNTLIVSFFCEKNIP